MSPQREVIQTTASMVATELARRGIGPNDRVTVTIELDQEMVPGRRESRALVIAAGLTDQDIDRLIDQARTEVRIVLRNIPIVTPATFVERAARN